MPVFLEDIEDAPPALRAEVEASSEGSPTLRVVVEEMLAPAEASVTMDLGVVTSFLRGHSFVKANASLTLATEINDVEYLTEARAYATGFFRLNDEPNVFFEGELAAVEASVTMGFQLNSISTLSARVKAGCSIGFEHQIAIGYELIVDVELIPDENTARGNYQEYVGKFTVGSEVIPFTRASVTKESNGIEQSLDITLARPSDRDKITSLKTYKFELNTIDENGDSNWETLIDSSLVTRNFGISWNANAPVDTLSLTSRAEIGLNLRKIPIAGLTVYDNSKITLVIDDFKTYTDMSARQFAAVLIAVSGLTLYDLFTIIFIDRCGLAEWVTNIPNFNVTRLDVTKSDSYLAAIGGVIGSFEPLIFIDDQNKVKIIDTTQSLPIGFPDPRILYTRNYQIYNESNNYNVVDGFYIKSVPNDTEVDTYYVYRLEQADEYPSDEVHIYTETTWKDYRTFDNPSVVINSVLFSETKRTYNGGTQIDEEYILWQFDALDRPTGYQMRIDKLTPEIDGTQLTGGPLTLQKTNDVYYNIFYGPHPYDPRKTIQTRTVKRTFGYAAIDGVNQQLGQDYIRDFVDVYEVGNLIDQMSLEYRLIATEIEDSIPLPNGQIKIKSYIVDHLLGIIRPGAISEPRSGEISVNNFGKQSNEIIIHRDENNPQYDGRFDDFSIGEIPTEIGIPLARRKLAQVNAGIQRANLTLIGRRKDITIGSIITAKDRSERGEVTLGVYLIEGMSLIIENAGTDQQLVTTNTSGIKIR